MVEEEKEKKNKTIRHLLTCAAQPGQAVELPRHFGRLGAVLGIVLVEERGRGVAGRHRFFFFLPKMKCDAAVSDGAQAWREKLFLLSCVCSLFLLTLPLHERCRGLLSAKGERTRERNGRKERDRERKRKRSAVENGKVRKEPRKTKSKKSTPIKIEFFFPDESQSLSVSPSPRFQGEREEGGLCSHFLPVTGNGGEMVSARGEEKGGKGEDDSVKIDGLDLS